MNINGNVSLDSWDDFASNWLKPEVVKVVPAQVVVMKVRADTNPDGDPQVVLTVNYNARKYDFSLNKTNQEFCKTHGINSPKLLENKRLTLIKDKVYNPKIKQRVDSLFIDKIE